MTLFHGKYRQKYDILVAFHGDFMVISWDFMGFYSHVMGFSCLFGLPPGVFTALQVLSYRDEDFFRGLRDLVELLYWRVNICQSDYK